MTNKLVLAGLFLLLIIPIPVGAANQQTTYFTPLYSHPTLQETKPIGTLDGNTAITLLLTMRPQRQDKLDSFVKDLSDPASSYYHQYLTPTEFVERFSPTAESYNDLTSFFEDANVTVIRSDNRLVLTVRGRVNQFEQLLGVKFLLYPNNDDGSNQTLYVASTPKVPYRFASLVYGIDGLDNATVMRALHQLAPMGLAGEPPFTPQQIRSAYGIAPLLNKGIDGSGQNVTIVVAYGSPTLSNDLTVFADQFSISSAHGNIFYPSGQPLTQNSGWAGETTLDVAWASVIAPGATINLVVSPTALSTDLFGAVNYAVSKNLGKIISLSWGSNESPFSMIYEPILQQAVAQGVSIFVSSGDCGAFASTSTGCSQTQRVVSYPASSPNVIAVGGTSLFLDSQDRYQKETGWNGSGGGTSGLFTKPSWGAGNGVPTSSMRSLPDISLVADTHTGVWLYFDGDWLSIGGTSLSAPLVAGAYALMNQMHGSNLGFAAPLIYKFAQSPAYNAIIHDVISGSNGYYQNGQGWDPVTGWGSPDIELLSAGLANQLRRVSVTFLPVGLTNISLTVDGIPYAVPTTLWFVSGSSHTFGTSQNVQASSKIRSTFTHWAGLINANEPTQTVQITGNGSLTLNYKAEYLLSVNTGSSQSSDWFDSGTQLQIKVANSKNIISDVSRQSLISWEIDGLRLTPAQRSGSGNSSINVLMDSYHTVNFNYVPQYYLKINGGSNTKYSNSQTNDGWYDAGTKAEVRTDNIWNVEDGQSRSSLASFQVDGGPITRATKELGSFVVSGLTMNNAHTIRFNSVTQYYLALTGDVKATLSPPSQTNDGWFDAGTNIILSGEYIQPLVVNQSRRNLVAWSLDGGANTALDRQTAGSFTLPNITMSQPHSIQFSYVTQYFLSTDGGWNLKTSPAGERWFDEGSAVSVTTEYTWDTIDGKSRSNLMGLLLDSRPIVTQRKSTGTYEVTINMTAPHKIIFQNITQYFLKVSGGSNITYGTSSPTGDNWYDIGSSTTVHTFNVWGIVNGQSRQNLGSYTLDGLKTSVPRNNLSFTTPTIVMAQSHYLSFNPVTQYYLTLSGGSDVHYSVASQTGDGWFDNGTQTQIRSSYVWMEQPKQSRQNLISYTLDGRTNDVSRANNGVAGLALDFNKHHSLTFNSVTQFYLTIIGGSNTSSTGSKTSDNWFDDGTDANIVSSPVWDLLDGRSRRQLAAWRLDSGEETIIPRLESGQFTRSSVKMSTYHNVNLLDVTQYWLAIDPSGGSVDKTSQWLDKGSAVTITATSPSNTIANKSRSVFTGWNGATTSPDTSITLIMDNFKRYNANWKTQYYVRVITPFSEATGEDWYDSGSTATVKITSTVQGILIQQVFDGWTGDITSPSPESKLTVNSPTVMVAKWRTDYTQLIIAGLLPTSIVGAGAVLHSRKKRSGTVNLPAPTTSA